MINYQNCKKYANKVKEKLDEFDDYYNRIGEQYCIKQVNQKSVPYMFFPWYVSEEDSHFSESYGLETFNDNHAWHAYPDKNGGFILFQNNLYIGQVISDTFKFK